MEIDVTFDFRTDANGGDPDATSPTLKRYHRLLWSKKLPGGQVFELSDTTQGQYLYHHSDLGEFKLTSDAVMATLTRRPAVLRFIEQLDADELEGFATLGYTIGAMMIFPGNRIDGRWTINQARGCHGSICDRFDLTLECIRRHYLGWNDPGGPPESKNPLGVTLSLYADFFALFENLSGYVEFFLLEDLVEHDRVKFFMPFDGFQSLAVPQDVETYGQYRRSSMEFIEARNHRIKQLGV